ncbi:hypothetical protein [Streptomyces sp. 7N604]|uniref:hypothetical protein n=1 Tax=Streptomyces sp. 7N604 TaxID=3457415 RepID=UPI003FD35D65
MDSGEYRHHYRLGFHGLPCLLTRAESRHAFTRETLGEDEESSGAGCGCNHKVSGRVAQTGLARMNAVEGPYPVGAISTQR